MAKALVLGGATGLLGQALVRTLQERSWDVETLGREDGSLLDTSFLAHRLESVAADVIFNTVAWTQVDDAEDHPEEARLINRGLPDSLARTLNTLGHGFLVHYSTDFVFGGTATTPRKETDTPMPSSVYGLTKLQGEEAVLATLPERSCVLRTAWLFGHGRKNFVQTILEACRRRDEINVVHDQIGSPSYTADVALWSSQIAEAWVNKADTALTGIWHVANSGEASWCDLACEAVQLTSTPCRVIPIASSEWPQKARRPSYSALAIERLTAFLQKQPRSWPQALRSYLFAAAL